MIRSKRNILIGVLTFLSILGWSQNKSEQQSYNEEIIRYLGYEENLTRYVSLPYDATMNHNVKGNFLDIGFLLLIFIPLLFIWRTKSKLWRLVLGLLLFIMTIFSMGSAHVISMDGTKEVAASGGELSTALSNGEFSGLRSIVAHVYATCGAIYGSFSNGLTAMTGTSDHVTYPVLLAIVFLLFYVFERYAAKNTHFFLGAFVLFYCFFMLILSAGIIWYGFLLFPLLYLILTKYATNDLYRKMLIPCVLVFVLMSYFLKVSHTTSRRDVSFGMLQPPVLAYNFSRVSMNEFYEGYFNNVGSALDKINAEDESLIYKSGTFLTYLIENNNKRIFQDDVLKLFDRLVNKYKTKQQINKALKASGFKYIMVSLRLHKMDRTPDKSLTTKFRKMLNYLDQNGGVELLATNRYVQYQDESGETKQDYVVKFGPNVEVLKEGTFAVYELK